MLRGIEGAVHEGLCDVLIAVKRQGRLADGVDINAVARFIGALVDGLFKRRALEADFDGEWAVAIVVAATEAALAGRIPIQCSSPTIPASAERAAPVLS
jgi:TetR/AcrR family transcriptional repressor of uid operon